MKKRISLNSNDNKCIKMFQEQLNGKNNANDIVDALAFINDWMFNTAKNNIVEEMDAIICFGRYFYENYDKREDVFEEIKTRDPNIACVLLIVDNMEFAKELVIYKRKYEKLSKKRQKQIDKLIDYIWNEKAYRVLEVYFKDNDNDEDFNYDNPYWMIFDEESENEENLEMKHNSLKVAIWKAFFKDAFITLTKTQKDVKIINSFVFIDKELEVLTEDDLLTEETSKNYRIEVPILD